MTKYLCFIFFGFLHASEMRSPLYLVPVTSTEKGCFAVGVTTSFLTNVASDRWAEPLFWSATASFGSFRGAKYVLEREGLYYRDDTDKLYAMGAGIVIGTVAGKSVHYSWKGLKYLTVVLYKKLFSISEPEEDDEDAT